MIIRGTGRDKVYVRVRERGRLRECERREMEGARGERKIDR